MGAYLNPMFRLLEKLKWLPADLLQKRRYEAGLRRRIAYLKDREARGISPYPLPPDLQ